MIPNDLPPSKTLQEDFQKLLTPDFSNVLVATNAAGDLVGTATLFILPNLTRGSRPFGIIENVVVVENHRRQGIAKSLLHEALNIAESSRCYKVLMNAAADNEKASQLYQALGFEKNQKACFQKRFI